MKASKAADGVRHVLNATALLASSLGETRSSKRTGTQMALRDAANPLIPSNKKRQDQLTFTP
jgi:hypothetical protein